MEMADPQFDNYIVIADFAASAENELDIKTGDEILVLQSTSEGWSEGYYPDGRQGWFPSAYAKLNPKGRDEVIDEMNEVGKEIQKNEKKQDSLQQSGGSTTKTKPSIKSILKKKPGGKKKADKGPAAPAAFPGIKMHSTAEKDRMALKQQEKERKKEEKAKEREMKKNLNLLSQGLFKAPISAVVAVENHETQIPFIVRCCVQHILTGSNLEREGLFRISGVKTHIDELKVKFEEGDEQLCQKAVEAAEIDAVAGVLKQYFREIQEPLFTYKAYSGFVKAGVANDMIRIRALMEDMPAGHRETLVFMLGFLFRVAQFQEKNKMTEANLGIVFAPTLMRSPKDDDNVDNPETLPTAFLFLVQKANFLLRDDPEIDALLKAPVGVSNQPNQSLSPPSSSASNASSPATTPASAPIPSGPPTMMSGLPPPISAAALPPPL